MNDSLSLVLKLVLNQILSRLPLGTRVPEAMVEELSEVLVDFLDGELSNQKQLELMGMVDDMMRRYGLLRSV